MPYKSNSIKLAPSQDRRRKLTDEDKREILRIYKTGVCGTRPLAKQFGVSKKTIQIIVNPAIAEKAKQYRKEHWRDYRPTKEEWAATMREHRHYKHQLYVEGKLKEEAM